MRAASYRKDRLYNFLRSAIANFPLESIECIYIFLHSVFLAVTLSLEATPISCERCIDTEIKREREKDEGELMLGEN